METDTVSGKHYETLLTDLRAAALADLGQGMPAESVRTVYLGRKGRLTAILRQLAALPLEQRREIGHAANVLKEELNTLIDRQLAAVTESAPLLDRTVPPTRLATGSLHPISSMIEEMTQIFRDLSFEVVEGREIVSDMENFEMLNFTPDHPARDSHDTLLLTDTLLLRTHTTAIQVLEMKQRMKDNRLPIRIVMPGKTYRRESDTTHSPMFFQMDAVLVDTQTTLADLKGVFAYFVHRLFGPGIKTRFRPHYFPFTEPSAELDILWTDRDTKQQRWLEVAGCGMIHPDVLKRAGINPRIYQGWAFGMAIERPLMIRHNIKDIRHLYSNSTASLKQFVHTV
jgi:phenylalanyl-tRNA synthetase alpha chain